MGMHECSHHKTGEEKMKTRSLTLAAFLFVLTVSAHAETVQVELNRPGWHVGKEGVNPVRGLTASKESECRRKGGHIVVSSSCKSIGDGGLRCNNTCSK
jgi:hypothetical protein